MRVGGLVSVLRKAGDYGIETSDISCNAAHNQGSAIHSESVCGSGAGIRGVAHGAASLQHPSVSSDTIVLVTLDDSKGELQLKLAVPVLPLDVMSTHSSDVGVRRPPLHPPSLGENQESGLVSEDRNPASVEETVMTSSAQRYEIPPTVVRSLVKRCLVADMRLFKRNVIPPT